MFGTNKEILKALKTLTKHVMIGNILRQVEMCSRDMSDEERVDFLTFVLSDAAQRLELCVEIIDKPLEDIQGEGLVSIPQRRKFKAYLPHQGIDEGVFPYLKEGSLRKGKIHFSCVKTMFPYLKEGSLRKAVWVVSVVSFVVSIPQRRKFKRRLGFLLTAWGKFPYLKEGSLSF